MIDLDAALDVFRQLAQPELGEMTTTFSVLRRELFADLWRYAVKRGVNVAYCTAPITGKLAGKYKALVGLYEHGNRVIYLGPDHWTDPYVLAHEIGHHLIMCTKRGNQHHEADADRRGRELVREIAPWAEAVLGEELERELPMKRRTK